MCRYYVALTCSFFYSCSSCPKCGTNFPPCIASGKSLLNPTDAWQCIVCHHLADYGEINTRKTCPLCHSASSNKGI